MKKLTDLYKQLMKVDHLVRFLAITIISFVINISIQLYLNVFSEVYTNAVNVKIVYGTTFAWFLGNNKIIIKCCSVQLLLDRMKNMIYHTVKTDIPHRQERYTTPSRQLYHTVKTVLK